MKKLKPSFACKMTSLVLVHELNEAMIEARVFAIAIKLWQRDRLHS